MHIDGKCHCGAITYEAEIDPATVTVCHCTDCQVFSGSPFRAMVPATRANFKLLSGTPKIYIKTADSGNKRAQGFCAECGTPIYATSPTDPEMYGLRLGAVKQRAQLKPGKQIWCNSALPWAMDMNAIATKIAGQT